MPQACSGPGVLVLDQQHTAGGENTFCPNEPNTGHTFMCFQARMRGKRAEVVNGKVMIFDEILMKFTF